MEENKTNLVNIPYTISLYNSLPTLPQYLISNLFRIVRPLRKKYNITVNEVIIVNCMHTYNRFVSSSFSSGAIEKYVGYFNSNKIKYYVGSLQDKGFITLSGLVNGHNRYMLTEKSIEMIKEFDSCYMSALDKFIVDNGINV